MLTNEQHILYVFPGQGSQYPGMGSDLCGEYSAARAVYDQASAVLGYDVAELSFNDPGEQLNLTRFTQPALLTHSIACLEVFRDLTDDRLQPAMAAGHSLGEYSALVASKVLSFESALKLIQKRGEFMGTFGEGEMTAFPLDVDTIRPIAERFHCAIAGCNLPGQTVVGGRDVDLALVEKAVQEQFERSRFMRLKTEGAFHTYYMVEAAQHYRPVLEAAGFDYSEVRVLSNYTGGYHVPDAEDIRSRLFFQLFNPVLWHANLQTAIADGAQMIIEFGGGIGTASDPAGKRPNLESMIKKTFLTSGRKALYLAAINSPSLKKTSSFVRGIRNLQEAPGGSSDSAGETGVRLFVPTRDGAVNDSTVKAVGRVDELGLGAVVQIIQQSNDENLRGLEQLVGLESQTPAPFLERKTGTGAGEALYLAGEEMEAELVALHGNSQGASDQ